MTGLAAGRPLPIGFRQRLWYICRDDANRPNLAYAESVDGVNWTKSDLGLVEHGGSKRNNLVGVPSLDGAVFRNPKAAPGEEYVYVTHARSEGTFRYTSPDGLRWKRDAETLLPRPGGKPRVPLEPDEALLVPLRVRAAIRRHETAAHDVFGDQPEKKKILEILPAARPRAAAAERSARPAPIASTAG